MSVKSNYFKMTEEEFKSYLQTLKKSNDSISFLNNAYFYTPEKEINRLVLSLHQKVFAFDVIIDSLTSFSKRQIIQSFLLDEIQSTNRIENIQSTKHDIFKVIHGVSSSKDKKVVSIANAYRQLIQTGGVNVTSHQEVRKLYDDVLQGAIDSTDLPDGVYYRHGPVYVTNGLEPIHSGTFGEENIMHGMDEFLALYHSDNEPFTKMILCHFLLEHIHPFYDGNGRFGRFLLSNGIFYETKSYFAFAIALSFNREKKKYYQALKEAEDHYEFGCLNAYVEIMIQILLRQIDLLIQKLEKDRMACQDVSLPFKMSKSESKIFDLLSEASVFSNYGVSNDEIRKETGVSKRTIISTLNKFRKLSLLHETKIGKITFHQFNKAVEDSN